MLLLENNKLPLTLFIGILLFASLSHIVTDIYIPSLPAITYSLKTTASYTQLTLTAFMLSYSISQLIYGPLSDRVGRRKPLLFGLGLCVVGTLICYFSPSIQVLIFGRFIQGLGVAACGSVGRSVLRDICSGNQLAKISSHLGMVMVLATTTAPALGGYIQSYFNWQSVFLFLLIYSLLTFIYICKILPETHHNLNPQATQFRVILKNYFSLFTSKIFLGYTLCVSLAYAGIIAYISVGPFLLQSVVGLTPSEFGWLSLIIGAAIFSSFLLNSRLVVSYGFNKMLLIGIGCMLCGGVMMLIPALLGYLNTWIIVLPLAFFCLGAGLSFSNASAGAFHSFSHIAGTAGGAYGSLQILGGAVASAGMASLHVTNQSPLALVLIALSILSFLSWRFLAISPG